MNGVYVGLSRQAGLLHEMQNVAHNLANMSTTGFQRSGVSFSEHVSHFDGAEPSLSMAQAHGFHIDAQQGPLRQTGGQFDFAIEGEGYFLLETPQGERLSRAGNFTPNENGELVTPDGYILLDEGGAPVFVPLQARVVTLAQDGTLSADGQPLAQISLFEPEDPHKMDKDGGVLFIAEDGVRPAEGGGVLMQGFVENSNVNPVIEIARMIEVQRAYELGQGFLDKEDERLRGLIQKMSG